MRRLDWAEYRTTEYADIDPVRTIAILPTAAIEQHGPHLPVGVDTMIAEGLLDLLRARCPEDLDIRILPVQAVGKSNEHLHAPGTLNLSAENALRIWTEIGLSVARAGVRKIVIVNSHGGNLDLISILSRELRVQAGMLAVKCQWGSFGQPEGLYPAQELVFGIHGGDVETSLMLAFRPELVDMAAAQNFVSSAETDSLSPIGPVTYGWISSDLNTAGTVGNAGAATAQKGHATADHYVSGFIGLLQTVAARALPG
ncbi:MAG: creatininase family protein [Rhodobacteraceae bacterium]|nr:MAG: creatininase family protein [Paracoccaceae bacterium]